MDEGSTPIADEGQLAQVGRQARLVHIKSFSLALLLTVVLILVY